MFETSVSVFLALFFIAATWIGFRWTRASANRTLQLFRAFLPSWRFFDDFGFEPVLSIRVGVTPDQLGPWQPILSSPPPRRLSSLLANPAGNAYLACRGVLENLLHEIESNPHKAQEGIEHTVSYRLTRRLVQTHLGRSPQTSFYQFKLSSRTLGANPAEVQDVMVSPPYKV